MATLGIETLQMTVIAGRDASLGDFLANLLGAGIGVAAASTWRTWIFPNARVAGILAWLGIVTWLGILAGTAWALQRSLDFILFAGHWTPQSQDPNGYRGLVLSANLNHKPLVSSAMRRSPNIRKDLLSETVWLEADVVTGTHPDGLVTIASVSTEGHSRIVMLAQTGDGLVFRIRLKASDLRLRNPAVKLSRVFDHGENGASMLPLHIQGISTRDRLTAQLESAAASYRQDLRLTPNLGWTFFLPLAVALGRNAIVLTWLWIATLLAPVAYWAARGSTSGLALANVPVVSAVLIGFLAAPAFFGIASVAASEWVAAAAGIVLGSVAGLHSRKKTHHESELMPDAT